MTLNVPTIILLSPHADDIALSLGGWLARTETENTGLLKKIEVFTGFNWSSTMPHTPEADGDTTKATELRILEEQRFCDRFGMSLSFGMLPDTSILKIDHLEPTNLDTDYRLVILRGLFAEHLQNTIAFAPISLGEHIDHRLFTRAILETKAEMLLTVFYEDLPYSTWFNEAKRLAVIREKLGESVASYHCQLGSAERQQKRECLRFYRSQINEEEVATVMDYHLTGPDNSFERVWVVEPSETQKALVAQLGFTSCNS